MNRQQRRAAMSHLNRQTKHDLKERIRRINEKFRQEQAEARYKAEQALWTLLATLGIKEASGRWWGRNPCSEVFISGGSQMASYSKSDFAMFDRLHSQSKGRKY